MTRQATTSARQLQKKRLTKQKQKSKTIPKSKSKPKTQVSTFPISTSSTHLTPEWEQLNRRIDELENQFLDVI
jgi:hypothetical protein